jgi:maltose/maltodextrin transport system substrate-binding protein
MKKTLAILLAMLFITTIIFSQKTIWVSWEGEQWFNSVAAELESELNEKIQVVYVPELEQKLSITLKGNGELPDICLVKTDSLPLILKYQTPVSYAEIGINQAFNQTLLKSFEIDDTIWAVPFYADMQLMYFSTAVFEKLGLTIPDNAWTMDDFEHLMGQIQGKEVQPTGWGINSAYIFTGLQEGLGTPLYNEAGGINLVTDKNIELVKRFKYWYESGLTYDYVNRPNIVKAFSKKQLAMFPQGSFLIQKFLDKKIGFEVRNLPSPWKSVIDPKGWVLFNNDEPTRKILGRLLEKSEEFASLYIKYPAVPVSDATKIPYYSVFDNTIKSGIVQPIKEDYVFGYWPAMRTALDLILKDNADIEESLKTAQGFIDNK